MHDLRDWTHDRHRTTDDSPYGGGAGMVMKPEPIAEAVDAVQALEPDPGYVVFMTPAGRVFDQRCAEELADEAPARVGVRPLRRLRRAGDGPRRPRALGGRLRAHRWRDPRDARDRRRDPAAARGSRPRAVRGGRVVRRGACSSIRSTLVRLSSRASKCPTCSCPATTRRVAAWRREQSIRKTARLRPDLLERASLTPEERRIADEEIAGGADPEEGSDQ